MADTKQNYSGGIGFGGALFITFLVLKLTGVINWSWWWVTAPLWGGLVLILGAVATFVLAAVGITGFAVLLRRLFKR